MSAPPNARVHAYPDNPHLLAALMYARLGWPVFPLHWPAPAGCSCGKRECCAPAKHPRTEHGVKDATTDETKISEWWATWPQSNLGIATGRPSGFIAVDVDPRNGGKGSLRLLEETHEVLPPTATVRTGGGGHHLYFKSPPAGLRCKVGLNGLTGLDLRGDGGYVVAPPSLHADGIMYTWESTPDDTPLAELPEWFVALVGQSTGPGTEEPEAGRSNEAIPVGQRNACLASLAGAMRRRGASLEAITAALLAENATRCKPPLPEREVHEIAMSISRYAPADASAETRERETAVSPQWPDPMALEALYGLAGDFVRILEPHTEADSAALLVDFLVSIGNVVGHRPYATAEADRHALNLFAVMVGASAKGRKGVARGRTRRVLHEVDPDWDDSRLVSGLSSGEGLIYAVRDPVMRGADHDDRKDEVLDPGVSDKRLLVIESEFASTLKVMGREGNTLSEVMRRAWDSGDLRVLNKNSPVCATGAHISVIGHITVEELRRHIDRTELGNGFANRFLWIPVRRSKLLPEAQQPDDRHLRHIAAQLRSAVGFARLTKEFRRDEAARELWADVYPELSEGRPGLLGAVTNRAEAQVMRLACLYALLDRSDLVGAVHLRAALAVWSYAFAGARWIFGNAIGDPLADELLRAMRARVLGMTRTEIRDLFGRNRRAEEIDRALRNLAGLGLARSIKETTSGRPAERWSATSVVSAGARPDA